MKTFARAVAAGLVICAAGAGSAADVPAAGYDVAITGPAQPVRLRFTVTVRGKPWRQHCDEIQSQLRKTMFARMDRDGDGALSAAEAKRLPAPRSWSTLAGDDNVHVAFNFRVLDANGDGQASADEYAEYTRTFGTIPMRFVAAGKGRSGDDLFAALDANRDRVLSVDEWSAPQALLQRDLDGNRVLSVDELRGVMTAAQPPEFVAGGAAGSSNAPWKLELVPVAEGAVDIELQIDYMDDGSGAHRPKVNVKVNASGDTAPKLEDGMPAGEVAFNVAGRRLVVRIPPHAVRAETAMRRQLVAEFESVQTPGESKVSVTSTMPALLRSIVGTADENDDGQLERTELDRFVTSLLPLQIAADGARLRIVQLPQRSGAMAIADTNGDHRISIRELQQLPARMTAAMPGVERVQRDALPSTITMVLQHGPFSQSSEANLFENAGPAWFVHADRNQDGDLDFEEFLGPAADFRRLDANGDHRIDLDEAILGDHLAPEGGK